MAGLAGSAAVPTPAGDGELVDEAGSGTSDGEPACRGIDGLFEYVPGANHSSGVQTAPGRSRGPPLITVRSGPVGPCHVRLGRCQEAGCRGRRGCSWPIWGTSELGHRAVALGRAARRRAPLPAPRRCRHRMRQVMVTGQRAQATARFRWKVRSVGEFSGYLQPLRRGEPGRRVVGYRWHLREIMASRGMFATTDLGPYTPSGA